MKTPVKLFTISALLCLVVSYGYAQQDSVKQSPPRKSYLKIGADFISNNVYLGRTDTVNTPTLSPNIKYVFSSGIYLSGSMDIIINRNKNKLDGGNIEAGYDYIGDGNLDWGASFTKLFFNSTSTQVDASISSELNAYVDYNIADIITPSFSMNYQIAKSGYTGDFMINPSLSHDFLIESVFGDDDKLLISPQVGLNAGSENFYSAYLIRKGKLNRKQVNAAYDAYDSALGDFVLLDYEVSLPLVYQIGKFSLSINPTYAFAQDHLPNTTAGEKLITASIDKTQPFKTSVFYVQTGVSFKF